MKRQKLRHKMAKCDRCDRSVPASELKTLRSWYQTSKVKDICDSCEKDLDKLMTKQRKKNEREIGQFLDRTEESRRFVPLFTRLRRLYK